MDIEAKRREIRRRYFPIGGLIIVSILGGYGIFVMFFSGIFDVKSIDMLYDWMFQYSLEIIVGLFFFIICLYCWLLFIFNIVVPPKKEVLYLYKNDKDEVYFLNRKGKKFIYNASDMKENCYYYVLKTRDYIYDVLGKTKESWLPKDKKSYWLNLYSSVGNFKDIFLLPIVYIFLLIGFLSFFMSEGFNKIYGILFSILPVYIIGYDLIYKIKTKKSNNNEMNETLFSFSYEVLISFISVVSAIVMCVILIVIFSKLGDLISKLIFLPFLGCGLCGAGSMIAKVFKNNELENIFSKGYVVIFLIYWFGFILFWTIGIIKQEGNYLYVLFSVPFIIAGLFVIYQNFIKK